MYIFFTLTHTHESFENNGCIEARTCLKEKRKKNEFENFDAILMMANHKAVNFILAMQIGLNTIEYFSSLSSYIEKSLGKT